LDIEGNTTPPFFRKTPASQSCVRIKPEKIYLFQFKSEDPQKIKIKTDVALVTPDFNNQVK
jgi:hypothetical protein